MKKPLILFLTVLLLFAASYAIAENTEGPRVYGGPNKIVLGQVKLSYVSLCPI